MLLPLLFAAAGAPAGTVSPEPDRQLGRAICEELVGTNTSYTGKKRAGAWRTRDRGRARARERLGRRSLGCGPQRARQSSIRRSASWMFSRLLA
jgi:hypothetical protein